jgi:hypothetical protein
MPAIPDSMQYERYADECRAAGVLDEYEALIAAGNPPGAAAMFALQSPPGSRNTDRAFCEGQRRKMENMDPRTRKGIVELAKKAGINTDGKFFMGGLGGYTNPAAWVSCAEDVVTSCKVQNKGVEGVINFQAPAKKEVPPPSVPLSETLIKEMSSKYQKADPGLAERCKKSKKARNELREMVVAKHGRKPKR